MKFEIERFHEFADAKKVKAGFTIKTEGGMFYECKLVDGQNGYFVVSAQSRMYDKSDGTKGNANAFGALKGTPAAQFFDEVAKEAAAKLRNDSRQGGGEPFNPDDDIPFN